MRGANSRDSLLANATGPVVSIVVADPAVPSTSSPARQADFLVCRNISIVEFAGNNTVACGGRLVWGGDSGFLAFTCTLLVVPVALFCGFVLPEFHWSLTVVAALLFVTVLGHLLVTASTDPGIIPRGNADPPSGHDDPLLADGWRYCRTCRIYRPPRAKHCRVCDNCVMDFDHHCPWTGTCVGQRNYRSFVRFVVSVTLLTAYVASLSLALLILFARHDSKLTSWTSQFGDAVSRYPMALVLSLFTGFLFLSVAGLAAYHLVLVVNAETTNESMRGVWAHAPNPYSLGGARANCRRHCCGPIPPPLLSFIK